MKKVSLPIAVACAVTLSSCATTQPGQQIAGHPYRTDPGCHRTEPRGTFDPKCDYPVVGIRGFSGSGWDMTPGIGGGSGGMAQ